MVQLFVLLFKLVESSKDCLRLLLLPLIPNPDLLIVQVLCSPHVIHCLLMIRRVDWHLAMSAEEVPSI